MRRQRRSLEELMVAFSEDLQAQRERERELREIHELEQLAKVLLVLHGDGTMTSRFAITP